MYLGLKPCPSHLVCVESGDGGEPSIDGDVVAVFGLYSPGHRLSLLLRYCQTDASGCNKSIASW